MKWKIYNRKGFYGGALELALGLALPLTCAVKGWERFDIKDGVLTVLLVLLGIGMILRSFHKEQSQEDWVEDHDERRRWVQLRSQALCYRVLWWLLAAGMAGSAVGYGITDDQLYIGIFLGCLVLYGAVMVVRLAGWWYYEKRE